MKRKTLVIGAIAAAAVLGGGWALAQSASAPDGFGFRFMHGEDSEGSGPGRTKRMHHGMGPGMMKGMGGAHGDGMAEDSQSSKAGDLLPGPASGAGAMRDAFATRHQHKHR